MPAPRARITGKTLLTEKKSLGAAGNYKFTEARVQTGTATIEIVRFGDQWLEAHDAPRAGDILDIEVEATGYAGRGGVEVNYSAVGPFDDSFLNSLLEAAA